MLENKKNILIVDPHIESSTYYKYLIKLVMKDISADSVDFNRLYSIHNKYGEQDILDQVKAKIKKAKIDIAIIEPADISKIIIDEILNAGIKILAITGRANVDEIENFNNIGLKDVITKPAEPRLIIKRIHSILKNKDKNEV